MTDGPDKLLRGDAVFDQTAEQAVRMAHERFEAFVELSRNLNGVVGRNSTEERRQECSHLLSVLIQDPETFDLMVRMANLGCIYVGARMLNRPVVT